MGKEGSIVSGMIRRRRDSKDTQTYSSLTARGSLGVHALEVLIVGDEGCALERALVGVNTEDG